MKKKLLIILFSFLSLSFFLGLKFKKTQVKDTNTIIVSFTILEDIVSQIAGEEFVVYSITERGEEVHGYKPTPSDLIKASNGLIFIENGFGFELWADKFLSNLNLERITISDYLEPIYIAEDAYAGKPNPHAWISPKRGNIYIDAIVLALTELKPESEEIFVTNGKIYKDRLSQIDKEFSLFINTLKKNERYLVSCEGAFTYLTKDYGLEEAYLWPVNAETQITPKRMAKVIKTVKENDIPAVFCESTVSAESQLTVVEETGAIFGGNLFVDSLSLEGGPASTYIELLEYNLETIKNSFHTHQEG